MCSILLTSSCFCYCYTVDLYFSIKKLIAENLFFTTFKYYVNTFLHLCSLTSTTWLQKWTTISTLKTKYRSHLHSALADSCCKESKFEWLWISSFRHSEAACALYWDCHY